MWADFTSAHLFGYTAQADDYLACAGKRGTMNTQKGNQKHLTLSDRINIEKGLNNSDSFAAIASLNQAAKKRLRPQDNNINKRTDKTAEETSANTPG